MSLILLLSILFVTHVSSDNATDWCDEGGGQWGALLEQWTLADTGRQGRILALPAKGYYVTDRIDLIPPPPPRRTYSEEWQMTPPHAPSPGKIVNRPQAPYKDKFKPSLPPPQPPTKPTNQRPGPNSVDRVDQPPQRKEVSETDLYLLGAIEKLVYRVDIMEKRLRKMEDTVHYLVVGKDKVPDPCPDNFTRVGKSCYHFSAESLDWKTANIACRKLRSAMLELREPDQRRSLFAGMQANEKIKDMDWWTGGLNPGLLWIWSSSARPVLTNSTSDVTVVGDGRCLALVYDAAARSYVYRGQDCQFRHRYICEKEEDKTKISNEIERVARQMKLAGENTKNRKSKILWSDE